MSAKEFTFSDLEMRDVPKSGPMSLESRLLLHGAVGIADLLDRVCAHFAVTRDELVGSDRHAHIAQARHVAAWLLRQRGFSFPAIGRALGKDHTTVMVAIRKVDRLVGANPDVAAVLEKMKGAAA